MDTKILIEVTCPYCGSKLMLKKNVEIASKTLICPYKNCGKQLKITFDITKEPQTYRISTEADCPNIPQKDKTIYKKQGKNEEERNATTQKRETIYKKAEKNTYQYGLNKGNSNKETKRHWQLKEHIFLTHITWFGFKLQKFQLYEGTTTVGRYDKDVPSDISIRGDETMSRRSIEITIEEENGIFDFKLKVLNATNQVKVNDQRVKEGSEIYLEYGDIITLGKSKFKFDNH